MGEARFVSDAARWVGYQLGGTDCQLPRAFDTERYLRVVIVCTLENLNDDTFRTLVACARARCRSLRLEVIA